MQTYDISKSNSDSNKASSIMKNTIDTVYQSFDECIYTTALLVTRQEYEQEKNTNICIYYFLHYLHKMSEIQEANQNMHLDDDQLTSEY